MTSTAKYFLLSLLCLVAVFAGCHSEVQQRLLTSLEAVGGSDHEYRQDGVPYDHLDNIAAELRKATPRTLATPTICDARLHVVKQGKEVMLLIYWIEDYPTPDALQLLWDGKPKTGDYNIVPVEMASNLADAKVGVVFNASWYFALDSEEVKRLRTGNTPRVVLLKSGSPVSSPHPVTTAETWRERFGKIGEVTRSSDS